ncbi:hypothetical protein ACI79G_15450 [Geodermatophilus sp. SYSU D00779]
MAPREEVNKVVVPLPSTNLRGLDDLLAGVDSDGDSRAVISRLLDELAGVPSMTVEAAEWHGDTSAFHAMNISPASEIGRAISAIFASTGRTSSTGTLYRMVVPSDLAAGVASGALRPMQAAAGVGLRSPIVDGAGNVRGHAGFVPVRLNRSAVLSSVGISVALAAVTAILEYQARKDELARFDRIEEALRLVKQEQEDETIAELKASWQLLKEAAAVLVGGQPLGSPNGVDAAAFHARKAFEKTARKASRLAAIGEVIEAEPTPDALGRELRKLGLEPRQMQPELELVFSALQLERARILLVAEQSTRRDSQGQSVDKIMALLRRSLADVLEVESQLQGLADRLDTVQLKMPDGILSGWWSNGRTEHALFHQYLLHVVTNDIRRALAPASEKPLAVDIVYAQDGTMTLLDPSWAKGPRS